MKSVFFLKSHDKQGWDILTVPQWLYDSSPLEGMLSQFHIPKMLSTLQEMLLQYKAEDRCAGIFFFNGRHVYSIISIIAVICCYLSTLLSLLYCAIVDTLRCLSYLFQMRISRIWNWMGIFFQNIKSQKFWFFIERIVRKWKRNQVSTLCYWFETKTVLVWPRNLIAYFLTQGWCHFETILLWISFHTLDNNICRFARGNLADIPLCSLPYIPLNG